PAVAVPVHAHAGGADVPDAAQGAGGPAGRGPRARGGGAGAAGRGAGALPGRDPAADQRDAHPHARRLSPGPGAVHGQGLRAHRLRGRARAAAERAPSEALAPARRGGDAAVVPLRGLRGATRPGGARAAAARARDGAGPVGELLAAVGGGDVPARLPGGGGRGVVRADRARGAAGAARRAPAGEGGLRAGLRAEQPSGLGGDSAAGHPASDGRAAARRGARASHGRGRPPPERELMATARAGRVGGLRELARLYGVQTEYYDIERQRQHARPDALLAVLQALGAPLAGPADVPAALRARRREPWQRGVEPVTVVWQGRAGAVELRRSATRAERPVEARVALEGSGARRWQWAADALRPVATAEVDGERYVVQRAALPKDLPVGYHCLALQSAGRRYETLLLCAPRRVYAPRGAAAERAWGVFLPVYAMRSA